MNNKKRIICFSLIAVLSIALAVTLLTVPLLYLVAKDPDGNVVFQGAVNLLQYTKNATFVQTDAFYTYFYATGPVWLAATSVMMCFLVVAYSLVTFAFAILELVFAKRQNVAKHNTLAKKLGIFTGAFAIFVFIFGIVAFYVTTAMANGYVIFIPTIESWLGLVLGVGILVLACISGKKTVEQNYSKTTNATCFALTALFCALSIVMFFVPLFNKYLMFGRPTNFWEVASQSTKIPLEELPKFGDFPLGILQWAMLFAIATGLFIFIYSAIGFILTLCGKKANWLSVRIKRWSIVFVVINSIAYMLAIASVSVLTFNLYLDAKTSVLSPIAYFAVFFPFLPLIFSCLVSRGNAKKKKLNK